MLQNLLFVMSLSGTTVFIFYLLIYPLAKRYFSLKWRYRILKISMVFYLLPFPLCRYLIWGFMRSHFEFFREKVAQMPLVIDSEYIIVMNQDSIRMSAKVQYMLAGMALVGLVSLVMVWKQIVQYRKMKKTSVSDLGMPINENGQELFSKIKKGLNIKRNVKFICSEYCKSPMTCGVLKPVVIFPVLDEDRMMDSLHCEYMIKHELVHIRHNDVLIKLAGILVIAIHWFNPFVYFLFAEISCVSEMYCDSIVLEGKGEKERRKYGELLLILATENIYFDREQFFVGLTNSRSKKLYKRRILEMKENRKHRTFLSAIATVFICMAGGITVFAYNPPNVIENNTDHDMGTESIITTEPIEPEKLVSDYFFVADDGSIYDISDVDEEAGKSCVHDDSVSGTATEHQKDGKDGCTMETYDALICTDCSNVKSIKLISTATYVPCHH